jgi:NAD(P)H-dependent FMN reductase
MNPEPASINWYEWLSQRWKAVMPVLIVILAGGIAQGLIVGSTAAWITIILGAITTGAVHQVKNQPAPRHRT